MPLFSIDTEKCHNDGICAAVCPRGIIDFTAGETPQPADNADEQCISCGHCMAVCPHGALALSNLETGSFPARDTSLLPSLQQMEQLIRGRRSIRTYQSKTVDRDIMAELITLASYAPTARNSQLLQWLVVDTDKELQTLGQMTIDWMESCIADNDPSATAYGFEHVLNAWHEGKDPILRGAPGLLIIHAPAIYPFGLVDSSITMTTLELLAAGQAIGTCWAGFFMIAAKAWKPIRDYLELPQGRALTTAMMIGYPKYQYARLPKREDPVISWR